MLYYTVPVGYHCFVIFNMYSFECKLNVNILMLPVSLGILGILIVTGDSFMGTAVYWCLRKSFAKFLPVSIDIIFTIEILFWAFYERL